MDEAGKALQAALTAPAGTGRFDAKAAFSRWRDDHPTEQPVNAAKLQLAHMDLSGTDWTNIGLDGARFDSCTLDGCTFAGEHGSLYNVEISKGRAEGIIIDGLDCRQLRMTGLSCDRARLTGAKLDNAVFNLVWLRGAVFDRCRLADFTLQSCVADEQTRFTSTESTHKFRVDRSFLDALKDNGGLSDPLLEKMIIADEVGGLRMKFGGAYAWVHAVSLIVFLLPYLLFTGQRLLDAAVRPAADNDPRLYEALLGFILTAGDNWHRWQFDDIAWVSLGAFVVVVVYNAGRLVLLMSVYRFEREEAVFRRRRYQLGPAQKAIWRFVQWGYWISLVSIVINTAIFLAIGVPAPL